MLLYILKSPGYPATLFPKKNHPTQDENRVKAEKSCCRGDDDENDNDDVNFIINFPWKDKIYFYQL